jgi:hypothetical protein
MLNTRNKPYTKTLAAILKHSGDLAQAKHLTSLYGDFISSKFEYQGDLKKEK